MSSAAVCPCCRGAQLRAYHYETLLCADCGHAWFPDEKLQTPLQEIYGAEYFHGGEYENYTGEKEVLQKTFRKYVQWIRRSVSGRAKLLEVGCAYGYFLEVAQDEFDVSGIDIARAPVEDAKKRGLPAQVLDLTQSVPDSVNFEVVCYWDCLEHLPDPGAVIARSFGILAPGGKIFLTTGDRGALLPRLQGRGWRMYHPPSHLQYFTRRSLRALLEGKGFRVLEMRSIAQWHSVDNVFGGLATHSKNAAIRAISKGVHGILPKAIAAINFPIPTGDILWVAAQKV